MKRTIFVIDTHTLGNPTRIIVGGLPNIPGRSIIEKMLYVKKNLDHVISGIIWEPRGHDDMGAAILVPPSTDEADVGVIFRGALDYLAMCGHMTIGVVTALIETGIADYKEPETTLRLETPAGIVTARARVKGGQVENVTFRNVPSFLYKDNCVISVPGLGEISGDIAFGGNFYFIVNMEQNKMPKLSIDELVSVAGKILAKVNETYSVQHPEIPELNKIDAVVFTSSPTHPRSNLRVIYVKGTHIDRSPCGTGTSAVMASLYSKGELRDETFVSESILGGLYLGKIVHRTKVGRFDAIVPEITGKAWIHGYNMIVIDEGDPFKYGFRLREGMIKIPSSIDPYRWISS
ncbi:MAG: proline racemase family protein [Sulfolobales archaeon]